MVLRTAVRRRGGTLLTFERVRYALDGDDAFTVTVETSADDGATWAPGETRGYARQSAPPDLLTVAGGWGPPVPGLPGEVRQFDFLLGEWRAQHATMLPSGQVVAFPTASTASTASVVLGGRGVLEHSWYDVDPNLTRAAAPLMRRYDRAERRWKPLDLANRGNTLLDFGGAMEGDGMVLPSFDSRPGDPISRFVFHDGRPDAYLWRAETSTDRGATFATTWTIEVTRR